jgi:sugar transferase (PEP-CTERM/EpsH1 system associated)
MKILVVDQLVPYPPTDGGKIRTFNILKHLSRHLEVSFLSLFYPLRGEDSGIADYLKTFGIRVELVARPIYSKQQYRLRQLRGVLKGESPRNELFQVEEMADKIRILTENEPFDIVDIQRPNMAPYIKAISPTSCCRKILTLHDVPYVQYRRMVSVERDWSAKRRLLFMDLLFSKRTILKYARRFDKCIMVSEHDGDTLKRAGPDIDIAVVPNGVDATAYRPLTNQSAAPVLLFVGKMNYHPNVDGAIFFCQEVFPLIKQQIPDAKLLIVGSEPRDSVQALASEDVTVTGFVESVVPYYQQALVSVVPLRSGGGTRLKILESMALGRPVVSTSLGCEGLKVTQEENILIADTPADFVTQTVRLLRDEALRQRLITNGRNLVEGTYDWQAITQQLLHLYSETINKQQNRRFIN